ncbi:TPA: hypothetical protein ACGJWA_003782 [Pseudomonas aeruginosa]|uniref:hypothetical protein n=1 Tax=Pseudomonas aeruginosa TaxID=287 RepID=UPI000689B713|nr:hypothetical protein [Pseudomonas aeruginosa]HBO1242431.1 hypothetical protein [Pseudomonas aeruginosa]HBO1880094.1 hypothetical protein [Pseudomonas aeruginosa]HBO2083315.1 hypothetical protein [Pseudomonas aeruginosa]
MSKELNKAPVEQAGGDEREEFEAWMHTFDLPPQLDGETFADERYLEADCFGQFVYDDPLTQRCWAAWQARAALAQPSPVSEPLIYACKSLAQITSSDGSGHADLAMAVLRMAGVGDDERERLVNEWKAARAWKPAPAQAEKAEVERPEVVARVVHSNPVVLGQCAPLNANDELMTVAQHAASVVRWAEMFNRVEQERDAARAKIAELEANLGAALGLLRESRGFVDCDNPLNESGQIKLLEEIDAFLNSPVAQAPRSDHSELRRIAVALKNPLLSGDEASDLMVRYEALTMPDHIIALIDSLAQHSLAEPTAIHQWQFSNAWFDGSEDVVLKAGREGSPIRTLYTAPIDQAQHGVPLNSAALVAAEGRKYSLNAAGMFDSGASDECREVVDSVLPLEPSPSNSEPHCVPEIMAAAEGILTFMRSEKENGSQCTCCNGPHIFCRYFEGMSDFDDITRKARFRNDLEGRTFRLVLELLPPRKEVGHE